MRWCCDAFAADLFLLLMLPPLPLLCCASQTHSAASRNLRFRSREISSFSDSSSICFHQSLISGSVSQTTNRAALAPYLYIEIFLQIKPPCILAIAVAAAFRPKHRFWHLRNWQKTYKRNNPGSPCYFSSCSPTDPYKLISGSSRPPLALATGSVIPPALLTILCFKHILSPYNPWIILGTFSRDCNNPCTFLSRLDRSCPGCSGGFHGF